jgi:hypothetical protein
MASYYWVGGTGTWNSTSTTNWASTSGGSGGAGVPTSADDVFFDGNSDSGAAFTVTIGTGAVCRDIDANTGTALDQTMTLAGTADWSIHGSLTFPATNLTRTYTGTITFRATTTGKTVTTNGVAFEAPTNTTGIILDGVNGEWTLGSALTLNGLQAGFRVINGTFKTGNYNLSVGNFNSSGTNTRTIEFGSSTVTLRSVNPNNSALAALGFDTSTNLIFDAGTSTINCTANEGTSGIRANGQTFYNVAFTQNGNALITGANTFNNLTFASRTSSILSNVSLGGNQSITNTLTVQSGNTDPTRRILLTSGILGTERTITAAAIDFGSGVDFRDITAAGVASPFNATTAGDCGGNTNITFPAAKTVYRRGTGNFSATQWAATSGGSPAADQFPLAQDTMVFDANTTTGTHTINASYNLGTLTMTDSTTVTLAFGTTTPVIYGNVTLSNAVTLSGTGLLTFAGRSTQTITSAGKTFDTPITKDAIGTLQLQDNLTQGSTRTFTHTAGTVDLNGNTLTVGTDYSTSNSNTRVIAFGSNGVINCGGNFTATTGTGLTTTGTGTIKMSSASAKTFAGGGRTYPTLEQNGAGTLSITGDNTFTTIDNANTTASQISFAGGSTTTVQRLNLTGTANNLVSLRSSTTGTQYTIKLA